MTLVSTAKESCELLLKVYKDPSNRYYVPDQFIVRSLIPYWTIASLKRQVEYIIYFWNLSSNIEKLLNWKCRVFLLKTSLPYVLYDQWITYFKWHFTHRIAWSYFCPWLQRSSTCHSTSNPMFLFVSSGGYLFSSHLTHNIYRGESWLRENTTRYAKTIMGVGSLVNLR